MKKNIILYATCVAVMAVLAVCFVPEQVFQGKMVGAPDYSNYVGVSHEADSWNKEHPDDKTAWTGAVFSGMPTMMITGNVQKDWTRPVFNFLTQKENRPASTLILSLIGAFLLMLSLGVNPLLSVGGAVAITFCSYNLQIIQVGHNTKMLALAFMPWVLAGLIFTYKKALDENASTLRKWLPATLLGAVLFGFAVAFQIKANHVQITWYLALVIFIYMIGLIVWLCLSRNRLKSLWGRFLIASASLLVAGGAGIATNACELIPMWEYTSQTMRGGSELSGDSRKGLSLEYSTQWSYGWKELPNLMIPNFNGGATKGALPKKSVTADLLKKAKVSNYKQSIKEQPLYWGPQPNTAGPMYIGAISVFLFILGLMICDGKDRWWMLAAAVLAIGLALGNNIAPLTKFFHDYIPFYNKFRAVSMALVILQFVVPMLGFIALDKALKGNLDKKVFFKKALIAFGITGGICLIFSIFPGLAGDFKSATDSQVADNYASALAADRKTLLRNDAFASFLMIALAFSVLAWAFWKKNQGKTRIIASVAICALVVINLFSVDKRYLNSSHFSSWREFNKSFEKNSIDLALEKDNSYFRVVDVSTNPFSDPRMSYYNKSIGGYSAAKLQRYDDLINRHLKKELSSVANTFAESENFLEFQDKLERLPALSMLNTKYFILDYDLTPLYNYQAMGNVWFVNNGLVTRSADEEIAAIDKVDLRSTAILGPDYKGVTIPSAEGENDKISLVSYAPNELRYKYFAETPRAAVFSEIFYPFGWTAKLENDTKLEIFRTDWTLRGVILPAGSHELVMRMDPPSYKVGASVSLVSSIMLYLLLIAAVCGLIFSLRKK